MRWLNVMRETSNPNDHPKRCRVLIVDDTRASRVLLAKKLGQSGIQTTDAVDGMAAWKLLQQESFDIVISDYEMPRCSGLQLLAAMRHSVSKAINSLPMIIVSSAESGFLRKQIVGIQRCRFLTKPIDFVVLNALLQQFDFGTTTHQCPPPPGGRR